MNEYTKQRLKQLIAAICFFVCFGLIVTGQKTVGFASIGQMLLGLTGILVLLYLYNRGCSK